MNDTKAVTILFSMETKYHYDLDISITNEKKKQKIIQIEVSIVTKETSE